jgi:fructose-1,6-bisphosphatase/inositol monophosphatase family enzyme
MGASWAIVNEEYMGGWDCLAGPLLVAEAGGGVETQSADAIIARGGRVFVGTPGGFEKLIAISDQAYTPWAAGNRTGPVANSPNRIS